MLRIFRGERHVEGAAQPGQREQDAGAQARQDANAETTIAPPTTTGNGHSELGMQELPGPAAPAPAPGGSGAGGESSAADTSQTPDGPAPQPSTEQAAERQPGFLDRGRMRRRARFLRAARELAYRDLGGLVFDLHRFGQRNDDIVQAKLDTLGRIDSELRTLESALKERSPVTVLREAGVAACPRCAAIHGSGDRFCPTCGLPVDQGERPMAAPNVAPPVAAPSPGWSAPTPPPAGAWPGPLAGPAPASQAPPSALSPPVPLPPPLRSPVAAVPPPTRTRPRAGSSLSPADHQDPPPQGAAPQRPTDPAGTPSGPRPDAAQAALPAAPGLARRATDPPTEVIKSGLKPADSPQRTVAFDPISPHQSDTKGDEDPDRDRDSR